jgi:hypothetical protein
MHRVDGLAGCSKVRRISCPSGKGIKASRYLELGVRMPATSAAFDVNTIITLWKLKAQSEICVQ